MQGFGPLQPSPATPAPPINNNNAKVTIIPGAPAITVSGTTYSAPTSTAAVIVNGATSTLPVSAGETGDSVNTRPIVMGGAASSPDAPGQQISPSAFASLAQEQPFTTTIFPAGGPAITATFSSNTAPTTPSSSPALSTQPQPLVIGGQTLAPGSAIFISGTEISLPVSTTGAIVVGGVTQTLAMGRERDVVFTLDGGVSVTASRGMASATGAAVGGGTQGNSGGEDGGGGGNVGAGNVTSGGENNTTVGAGNGNGTSGYTGPAFGTGAAEVVRWQSMISTALVVGMTVALLL
ncbi:MAG: hypothetical protein Q9222_007054 [Ikaeria aurantiellina]